MKCSLMEGFLIWTQTPDFYWWYFYEIKKASKAQLKIEPLSVYNVF